jgi:stress responsive alpha/beta barrel protein
MTAPPSSGTLQHVVLFSFPDGPTSEQAEEIRAYVGEWPSVIPGIRALRFGEALFPDRTRGYQYLLYMEFDSVDDLRSYQAHPVHQKFLSWVIDSDITPLAFDYFLTDEAVLLPKE